MLKAFITETDTLYFNSETFTLSTSIDDLNNNTKTKNNYNILKKVVINISNSYIKHFFYQKKKKKVI